MEPEIEKGPNSVTMRIPKCPMYESFKTAGLDHGTMEKMCKAQAEMEYAGLKKHFPELEGRAEFRESPKGACVEEFRIK